MEQSASTRGGSAVATVTSDMPMRELGRTGQRVSILGLGGSHIGKLKDEKDGIRLIQTALDEGFTFLDNAWEYSEGRSEEVMGKALAMDGRRQKAFVMTKVCSREYAGAMQQLEESLKRLKTDYLDLWQFHECNYYNDPEWLVEKGGFRAAEEARKQGKVRFVGFTGHKSPAIHLEMLSKDFKFDTAQMPNNVMDAGFQSFRKQVMPVCQEKGVGILGMKGCGGDGKVIEKGYLTVEDCYRYCLSQPVSVQIVGLSSVQMLETALRVARAFKPLTDEEMRQLAAKIKGVQGDGRYELFKTSKEFDSDYHREQHGFKAEGEEE